MSRQSSVSPSRLLARGVTVLAAVATLAAPVRGQSAQQSSDPGNALAEKVQRVMDRPEFKHAMFGIAFYSLDDARLVYAVNSDKLFTAASTTKLLTMGTAMQLLGADYRFHTRVYHTGKITPAGTLDGDLILVASGDLNLSGRIQGDQLAFENVDHAYDGSPDTRAVPGDPLAVIREIAAQVAAKGIKQINGRVLIDASMYPEG